MNIVDELKYNSNGLIPAIVQEAGTGRVLMMAWMNKDSLAETIKLKKTCFWSRSRQKYWVKGETSGHVQHVKNISFDCDKDCLLIEVEQIGAACHDGYKSCFYRTIEGDAVKTTEQRLVEPEKVYGKK